MAITPALLGNVAVIKLNGTNLNTDGNQIKIDFSQDAHEASVFTDTWKEYIAGLASATLDFNGYYSPGAGKTDVTLMATTMLGAPSTLATFEVDPIAGGGGSGNPKFTGSMILTKYSVDMKVNAAIVFASTFRATGQVVRATL